VEVGPLGPAEGRVLAEELLYGEGLTPSAALLDVILEETGVSIPYFLHVLVDAILAEAYEPGPLAPEAARSAYRDRVLGPWATHAFKVFRLGAQSYPPPYGQAAGRLLRLLAYDAGGLSLPELQADYAEVSGAEAGRFDALLACLQEDFDLEEVGGRWRFRSKVLRDRWALSEAWLTEPGA
jgi:hypothetical protein